MIKWQKKENKDKKSFGGKRTPRSGGLWFIPGDVKIDKFLIDSKQTDHNSFSITLEIWKKIYREALNSRKLPCLSIELGDGTEVVVLDKNDFQSFFKEK
jgi:hypothetical protein